MFIPRTWRPTKRSLNRLRELRSQPEFLTLNNATWRKAWDAAREVYPHLALVVDARSRSEA
jgi:hypothetical protein